MNSSFGYIHTALQNNSTNSLFFLFLQVHQFFKWQRPTQMTLHMETVHGWCTVFCMDSRTSPSTPNLVNSWDLFIVCLWRWINSAFIACRFKTASAIRQVDVQLKTILRIFALACHMSCSYWTVKFVSQRTAVSNTIHHRYLSLFRNRAWHACCIVWISAAL